MTRFERRRRFVGRVVVGVVAVVGAIGVASCGGANGGPAPGDSGDGGVVIGADGCPLTMPGSSVACSGASAGKRCDYGCDTGGPGFATCTNGAWAVSRSNVACVAPPNDAGPPPADAPFACGTQTCGVTQYCVEPCCGGAGPQCIPADDAGACPAGFHSSSCQSGQGGPSCEEDPCKPPPPFCVDSASDPRASGCQSYDKTRTLSCLCA
jgi:hypothetical protein